MTALYKKSELWFALVWIAIYVVATSIADTVSASIGMQKSVTLLLHILLTGILIYWLCKNRLTEKFGLCKPRIASKKVLYYLPLVILCSSNLWFGLWRNMSWTESVLYMLSMICVGFLEEIIFRGFLFHAMYKDSAKAAIIVSSITFGLGHIVNLVNGSGAQILPTLCQIVYAGAVGWLFVVLFQKSGSLWPCIVTHSLVNAISAFAHPSASTVQNTILSALLLTLTAVGYVLLLSKFVPVGQPMQQSGEDGV